MKSTASGREGDTSIWLHNKLGTSNDTWVGGSICSQYNLEVLGNIRECFVYLQPQVKLKLLLSFFHIPCRNADEWHSELKEILELGRMDSDPWVAMVAEIMLPFPSTGSLSEEFNASESSGQIFHLLLKDLRKIIHDAPDGGILTPLESRFLNPNALNELYGPCEQPTAHFKLKRKPKAAALRAELLNKSIEAANQIRKHPVPTVPLRSRGMPRKLTDTTPLKGIPSKSLSNFGRPSARVGVRSLAGPKEGGIKLLEITEHLHGPGMMNPSSSAKKKGKKATETDASDKTNPQTSPTKNSVSAADQKIPDYAVNLVKSEDATVGPFHPASPEPMVDYETENLKHQVLEYQASVIEQQPSAILRREIQTQTANIHAQKGVLEHPKAIVPPARSSGNVQTITYATLQPMQAAGPSGAQIVQQQQLCQVAVAAGPDGTQHLALVPAQIVQTMQTGVRTVQFPAGSPNTVATILTQPPAQQTPAPPPPKKGLSLTREQMAEAQEMFRTANRVTRPEKALILGFMAGSRENPCPHLGNIVTIKLSEEQETMRQANGALVPVSVETLFQMNYNTGEWRRLRKHRSLQPMQ
ncbi:unnamed protein product [Notodromas monacha]|uniref:HDAg domain-containing protein n=1 Tax=Notodromas monacha TaxID=399045 RepID=A0A7R9BI00_9CRUS|nr:unnamed protein product [Notodromas monacha]CAG0915862.1 unnamed protein product [Notodromas monacha]